MHMMLYKQHQRQVAVKAKREERVNQQLVRAQEREAARLSASADVIRELHKKMLRRLSKRRTEQGREVRTRADMSGSRHAAQKRLLYYHRTGAGRPVPVGQHVPRYQTVSRTPTYVRCVCSARLATQSQMPMRATNRRPRA